MESRKGLGYAIAAYVLWGMVPLYFAALKPAGPIEVLVHRCLWTAVFGVLAGPVTGIPLLLHAGAARRLPLTMMGLLQYITPVLQFALGVTVFHEEMPPARLIGFGLVWIALVVLAFDGLRRRRGAPARSVAD